MEEFVLQNDIFDDRFSYHGDDFTLGITRALPFALTLGVRGGYQHKNYTYPAKDLADSLVLAPSREDRRSDVSASLTRTFAMGTGRSLKAEIEFHYLKNKSNAPYYDFDKTAWMAGLELGF